MKLKAFNNGFGLVIGVGADLPVTVTDAKAIYEVLTNEAKAGYPIDQVTLLTNKNASRENIIHHLQSLKAKIQQNPFATVLIYFSGHGGTFIPITNNRAATSYYLVTYDFDAKDPDGSGIRGVEFSNLVNEISLLAKKLILIVDCCHSQGMVAGIKKDPGFGDRFRSSHSGIVENLHSGNGKVILTSCRDNEVSYIDDTYSLFTKYIIQAMEGGVDFDQEGFVRIIDLAGYVMKMVKNETIDKEKYPHVQSPVLKSEIDDNFPICLYPAEKLKKRTPSLETYLPGSSSWVEPNPVKVFIVYSGNQKDEEHKDEIIKQLSILRKQKLIESWDSSNLGPGRISDQIEEKLQAAQVILFLLSPDFIHSFDCLKQMNLALELHHNNPENVILMPIYTRFVSIPSLLDFLKVYPSDKIPIASNKWDAEDEPYFLIKQGIEKGVLKLLK